MNIDLLMNGQAEAVSLSEQGMTVTEYIQHLVSTDNAPATMMVNKNNGVEVRLALSTTSYDAPIKKPDGSRSQMVINVNDMLTDNDVLLFRAKPATQGVGIGEALQQLIDEVKL
jgi:hypothetical protein